MTVFANTLASTAIHAQTPKLMEAEMTQKTPDLANAADQNQTIAASFFSTLERADIEAFSSMLAENARYENPFFEGSEIFNEPVHSGRDNIVALFRVLPDVMSEVRLETTSVEQTSDPEVIYVRTQTAFTFASDGYVYRNDILHRLQIRNGQIAQWTEFMDNTLRERAFGRAGTTSEEQ